MGVSDWNICINPKQPLSACWTEIHLLGGIPGVKYSLDNEGAVQVALSTIGHLIII
jgi:hypothetical protein